MNTAATASFTTYAGCLAQLGSLTGGIDMVPSRLSEEIIYTDSAEKQDELPRLINLDGTPTDVVEEFDRSFSEVRVPGEGGDELVKSSQLSGFVARVKALDGLLDRDVEAVMLGLSGRSPDTFESWQAFKEFDKFINGFGRVRVRKMMNAEQTSRIMADDAFETAKLADAKNRPEAVANAFFISGRLYAALKDIGMSNTDAGVAFDMAVPLFASAKRYVAVAICYELVAEMRELRNMNSESERSKAAEAWLKAVGRGKELDVDGPSLSMAIFRGMWNAYRAGDVQTQISFLEQSAEQFIKAERYASAADDYLRILNLKLEAMEEDNRGGWKVVDGYMDTLKEQVRKAELPGDLLQGLIDIGNDVHENVRLAGSN